MDATAVSRRAGVGAGGSARGGLGGTPHLRRRPSVADRQRLALAAAERPLNVAPGRACHRRARIRSEAAGGRGERGAGRSEGPFRSRGKIGKCDRAGGRARAGGYAAGFNARLKDRTVCAVFWVCGARQGVDAGARKVRLRGAFGGGAHRQSAESQKCSPIPERLEVRSAADASKHVRTTQFSSGALEYVRILCQEAQHQQASVGGETQKMQAAARMRRAGMRAP